MTVQENAFIFMFVGIDDGTETFCAVRLPKPHIRGTSSVQFSPPTNWVVGRGGGGGMKDDSAEILPTVPFVLL